MVHVITIFQFRHVNLSRQSIVAFFTGLVENDRFGSRFSLRSLKSSDSLLRNWVAETIFPSNRPSVLVELFELLVYQHHD